ncbi:MAG: heavy-metal-associated domain-containing protein [Candidatus Glassbacteria bacterium]|nr:heavy-metal-associated domain-containing protein [Candidatus Glassbacteria bacterium]
MTSVKFILRSVLSALALAAMVAFFQLAPAAENSAEQQKGEVRIYEVFGMGCPACQGGLAKLVKKVEGVSEAEVNWKEQRLKVTFAEGASVDDELIFEAIRKANFTPGKRLDVEESDGKS